MRPCFLYKLLPELARWKCKDASCFRYSQKPVHFYECECYRDCCELTGQKYKKTKKMNVVINTFRDNLQEVIFYEKEFDVIVDSLNLDTPKRNFVKVGEYLIPTKEGCNLMRMLENSEDGADRAYDNILGYALANNWSHFLTLTTNKEIVGNRYDDEHILDYWKKFRRLIQYYDINAKLLCIPERHKDGALHFHALMYTTYGFPLKVYYEDGQPQYSGNGDLLFEFLPWKYGLATTVLFPDENLLMNNVKVGYYLTKYVTKQNMQGYQKKRYYRSYNLDFKKKECANISGEDIDIIMDKAGMKLAKIRDGAKIYRNY